MDGTDKWTGTRMRQVYGYPYQTGVWVFVRDKQTGIPMRQVYAYSYETGIRISDEANIWLPI